MILEKKLHDILCYADNHDCKISLVFEEEEIVITVKKHGLSSRKKIDISNLWFLGFDGVSGIIVDLLKKVESKIQNRELKRIEE